MTSFPIDGGDTLDISGSVPSGGSLLNSSARPAILDTQALSSNQFTFNLDAGESQGAGYQSILLALTPFVLNDGVLLYESPAAQIPSTSSVANPGNSSLQFVKVPPGVDIEDVLDIVTGAVSAGLTEGEDFWLLGASFEVIAGANNPVYLNFSNLSEKRRSFATGDRLAVLRLDFPNVSTIGFGNAMFTVGVDYGRL